MRHGFDGPTILLVGKVQIPAVVATYHAKRPRLRLDLALVRNMTTWWHPNPNFHLGGSHLYSGCRQHICPLLSKE